jgi:hypothetical protein
MPIMTIDASGLPQLQAVSVTQAVMAAECGEFDAMACACDQFTIELIERFLIRFQGDERTVVLAAICRACAPRIGPPRVLNPEPISGTPVTDIPRPGPVPAPTVECPPAGSLPPQGSVT